MADEIKKEPEKEAPKETEKKAAPAAGKSGMMNYVVVGLAAVVCMGGGYLGARKMMAGPTSVSAAQAVEAEPAKEEPKKAEGKKAEGGKEGKEGKKGASEVQNASDGSWLFELEPVVANLDEPGVTRYVRATLMLEMNPALSDSKGQPILDEHKAGLRNWFTIYLAGCTLDDIRGRKNLMRIQAEVRDAFNDMLFKDSKPMVKNILFKEFQIQ